MGWGVRIVPLPHASSAAGQNLLQPQQTRSGCLGYSGVATTETSTILEVRNACRRILVPEFAKTGDSARNSRVSADS
jgi:hypothetical protein